MSVYPFVAYHCDFTAGILLAVILAVIHFCWERSLTTTPSRCVQPTMRQLRACLCLAPPSTLTTSSTATRAGNHKINYKMEQYAMSSLIILAASSVFHFFKNFSYVVMVDRSQGMHSDFSSICHFLKSNWFEANIVSLILNFSRCFQDEVHFSLRSFQIQGLFWREAAEKTGKQKEYIWFGNIRDISGFLRMIFSRRSTHYFLYAFREQRFWFLCFF